MSIQNDLQLLDPGAMVDLFILDASSIAGGGITYLHPGTNGLRAPIVWNGNTYQALPMTIEGFEMTTQGTLPRPTASVSNVGGLVSALILSLDDLVGAKVTRKRTFVKYLDAVNFPGSYNPTADPTAAFQDEVYYILRKVSEDNQVVTFELGSSIDVEGELLPGRQIIANVCQWQYRDGQCPYVGGAVAMADDTPTGSLPLDDCSKTIAGCRLRFPLPQTLPFGSFPSCGVVR